MDSFSFLKYWRRTSSDTSPVSTTTTIVTASSSSDSNEKHHDHLDNDDDGSFFDLEFALPEDGEISISENASEEVQQDIVINEDAVKLAADNNNNTIVEEEEEDDDVNTASSGVLKTATKLGVLMLKLKKCKSNVNEKTIKSESEEENTTTNTAEVERAEQQQQQQQQKKWKEKHKFFTVNLKGEDVPVLSLFTRDFSSKGETKKNHHAHLEINNHHDCSSPDKKIGKDVVNKYLKKVKPLYIRVSKRYGDKLGFSLQFTEPEKTVSPKIAGETVAAAAGAKSLKPVNLQAGMRLVYKQLGKSQSASSATVSAVPAAASRRDDSLLQHEDGIQNAILHCKRSFNASQRYEGSHLQESADSQVT